MREAVRSSKLRLPLFAAEERVLRTGALTLNASLLPLLPLFLRPCPQAAEYRILGADFFLGRLWAAKQRVCGAGPCAVPGLLLLRVDE